MANGRSSMREGELTMTCEGGSKEYRLDIRYPDGSYHGGLHCGATLEVRQNYFNDNGEYAWAKTRVESGYNDKGEDEYYLVGLYKPGEIPYGLTVRR